MYVLQLSKHLPLYLTINLYLFKFTFAHLRYSLGGDRPSQTTRHTLYNKLALKNLQGGIPLVFLNRLAPIILNSHLSSTIVF